MTMTRQKVEANVSEWTLNSYWWADLTVPSVADAKGFWGGLMGWTYNDMQSPSGADYSIASRDGNEAVGFLQLDEQLASKGVQPHWLTYFSVENVDAAAAQVVELGGQIMQEAFDIPSAGRMAVAMDPQGAAFALWQAGGHTGAQITNVPGALAWGHLSTTDLTAAAEFYGALFGWSFDEGGDQMPPSFQLNGRPLASAGGLEGSPVSNWLLTLNVDDADEAFAYVKDNGGQLVFGPHDTPWGRSAIVADPQGAVVGLMGMPPAEA